MNNSKIAIDSVNLEIETQVDLQPTFRKQATELATMIEALEKIQQSSYWIVLQAMFSSDLINLKSRLSKEKDMTEIFRLQGEIARCEKYDFAKMILEKRNQLANLKNQIDE